DESSIVVASDAIGAWSVPKLAPGDYIVAATAVGFVPAWGDRLAIGAGEQRTGIDLALAAGGSSLHGTVSDITGGPIAGARVTASRDDLAKKFSHAELAALTDAAGKYELTLPDGEF